MVFFLTVLIIASGILPVYAEVSEIQLDKESYFKEETINVSGTVEDGSSGLVSIVVRDPADKFVLLSQSMIKGDNSFNQQIPINEKFRMLGIHNATAFIFNMTSGKTQSFEIVSGSSDETSSLLNSSSTSVSKNKNLITEQEPTFTQTAIEKKIVPEPIFQENQMNPPKEDSKLADFVDENKDPQYYLDRYYNEPNYKSWFDRNYPNLSFEEAIGYSYSPMENKEITDQILSKEIIPTAEASSVVNPYPDDETKSDFVYVLLTIGGLTILLGAVYGIKKLIDSKHLSVKKDLIKPNFITSFSRSNPTGIIQTRLAKGEITIEEYEKLRERLEKNSK